MKGKTPRHGLGSERPCPEGRKTVKHEMQTTVELGDLIQAVFDEAARHSTNPREASQLATQAVAQVLWRHLLGQTRPRLARICN